MRELFKYLKDYKKECILSPAFKALEAGFELLVPLVIARMIDKGIPDQDGSFIIRCGFFLAILAFVGFACAILAQYFAAKAAVGLSTNLRHDLFSKLMHLSFSKIDEVGSSTMITRLTSDVNSVQAGVNMILRLFLRSPYIVIGATIMAFLIDTRSALLFVLLIFVLALIVAVLAYSNISLLLIAQQKLDKITEAIRENLSGTRVIRAFCRQEEQTGSFQDKNHALFLAQKKAGVRTALLNPITYIVINLFIVQLIRIGAIQVGNGTLTAGSVVALYNYMSQILLELVKFANLLITVNKAFSGWKRITDILHMKETGTVTEEAVPDPAADLIVFDHVSLKYHEDADEVLSDIDLVIKEGETVGIIGGTGAGKTSLAHLIAGFYRPTAGQVRILGRETKEYKPEQLTDMIGIAMQKPVLFQGTIADNLKWGREEAKDPELMEAVRMACCENVLEEHGGLQAVVNQGGRNYSGGQRQRLCIARALVKKPKVLILDDSFSALDYMTDRKLRSNLSTLSERPTIIMISQRTVSIQDCDHIIVLDDGRMVGHGTHEELLQTCDVYAEIYRSQGSMSETEGGVAS
ncbi:MAG: ABC transporter ATP-binding protein [Lachnospiraceae bacterium]|nr:ABC transporter ATP-binding protein [Lachnospiraceae bacterium]